MQYRPIRPYSAWKLRAHAESAKVLSAQPTEGTGVTNNKPPAPATSSASSQEKSQDRYVPGDPIPVPDAIEANTESSWALFSDVPRQPEQDFLDTVPASLLDEELAAIVRKKAE